MGRRSWIALTLSFAVGLGLIGCGAKHLMLAEVPVVTNLGPVSMASGSAPIVEADGKTVIYLQTGAPGASAAVMERVRKNDDRKLFSVPGGSSLWTLNYHSGALLFSIADAFGNGNHIVEFSPAGTRQDTFPVPPGYQDSNPTVSPDGRTLAFMRRRDGAITKQLYTRDLSSPTSALKPFLSFVLGESILTVRWIDDDRIFVSSRLSNTIENAIQVVSSGNAPDAPGFGFYATPDPTGKQVIASFAGPSGAVDLTLKDLRSGNSTEVTATMNTKFAINWSAKGDAIVYETRDGGVSSLEVVLIPRLE